MYLNIFRCTTIRCITSTNVVSPRVLDEEKVYTLAGDIVNLLLEMRFDKHPIFFHTFSNGGATVYRYVSERMQNKHAEEFKVICLLCPSKSEFIELILVKQRLLFKVLT